MTGSLGSNLLVSLVLVYMATKLPVIYKVRIWMQIVCLKKIVKHHSSFLLRSRLTPIISTRLSQEWIRCIRRRPVTPQTPVYTTNSQIAAVFSSPATLKTQSSKTLSSRTEAARSSLSQQSDWQQLRPERSNTEIRSIQTSSKRRKTLLKDCKKEFKFHQIYLYQALWLVKLPQKGQVARYIQNQPT